MKPIILFSLLLAVACGAPFEAGARLTLEEPDAGETARRVILAAPGGAPADADGSPGTGGASHGTGGSFQGAGGSFHGTGGSSQPDAGYASGGRPNASGGASQSGTGGFYAPGTGGLIEAGTGGVSSTGGAPTGTGGSSGCAQDEKLCAGTCTPTTIAHGCAVADCSPCLAPPANGYAKCAPGGYCTFDCLSGFHPAGTTSPRCDP